MTFPSSGDWPVVDRGSITPIMMAVVVLSVVASSLTARIGRTHLEMARVDSAADAVALALATGDEKLGRTVAELNKVRIINLEISGEGSSGFEVLVTVASALFPGEKIQGKARASTKP